MTYKSAIINALNNFDGQASQNNETLSKIEKSIIIKARIGQGKFRDQLLSKFGKCIVTGLENPKLLIASHIKPWALCENNNERLSCSNGLLLSPLFDKLFDSRLISFLNEKVDTPQLCCGTSAVRRGSRALPWGKYPLFSNRGKILLSNKISSNDILRLNVDINQHFNLLLDNEMRKFLDYHRDTLCLGEFK